jgi:citrate lyase subunit beta/citryl-CoA lyase
MPRRSVLFSPGDRPEMLRKAPDTAADVLVFDLEDAVAPGAKAAARESVRSVLAAADFDPAAEVVVRVNPGEAGAADVRTVLGDADARVDAVMVPKVAGADDVAAVADLCADAGRPLPVFALLESAAGVLAAEAVAAAEPTTALVFGAEDLAADVGATRTREGTEVLYAREHVVLAAAAAGVDAIDTLYTAFSDEAGLREDAAFAARLGYDGKLAVHPRQVPVVNEAFAPDPGDVEWARRVLAGRDATDRGVFEVDGEMIDAPLVARAERILERAGESVEDGAGDGTGTDGAGGG